MSVFAPTPLQPTKKRRVSSPPVPSSLGPPYSDILESGIVEPVGIVSRVHSLSGTSDDRDEGHSNKPTSFLRKLWYKPAEKRPRGAPIKAGEAQIKDKAAVIMNKAELQFNPVAATLGLGDCMIVKTSDTSRTTNRPFEKLTAAIGQEQRTGHNMLSYHITWVAANGPTAGGREYSHRCHQKCCVATKHGVWESGLKNTRRKICADGKSHFLLDNGPDDKYLVRICPHEPECLSGTLVANMQHPAITKL
ncbi:MAG: hypothetical protein Q9214_002483 [Letrouitia sp. 1 TL-2023]